MQGNGKRALKRMLAVILAISMVFGNIPFVPAVMEVQAQGDTILVNNEAQFKQALITASGTTADNAGTVKLAADIVLSESIKLPYVDESGQEAVRANPYITIDLAGHGIRFDAEDSKFTGLDFGNLSTSTVMDSAPDTVHYITLSGWRGVSVSNTGTESTPDENGDGVIKVTGGYLTGARAGAIKVYDASLTMTGGTICGNTGFGLGYKPLNFGFESDVSLSSVTVCHNTTKKLGAGIYAYSGAGVTMTGCSIHDNRTSADSGAGLYLNNAMVTMMDCSVRNNEAYVYGGGIYAYMGSLIINGGVIDGNKARYAGGIYVADSDSSIIMNSAKITNNTAEDYGGVDSSKSHNIELSGSVVIKGNRKVTTGPNPEEIYEASDLRFDTSYPLIIIGELTEDAEIGIIGEEDDKPIAAAKPGEYGYNDGSLKESDVARFFADTNGYGFRLNDEGQAEMYYGNALPEDITIISSLPYNGQDRSTDVIVKNGEEVFDPANYILRFYQDGERVVPENAGIYDVEIIGTGLYLGRKNAGLTIEPKEIRVSGIKASAKTYDGTTAAALDYSSAVFNGICEGDELSVTAVGAFSNADAGQSKTVSINALTLGGKDKDNYVLAQTGQQSETKADINKADSAVTAAPQAKTGLKYTGEELELITAGAAAGGVLKYALAGDEKTIPSDDAFAEAVPKAKDAGTYHVRYKVFGDKNHNDTETAYISVVINKAEGNDPVNPDIQNPDPDQPDTPKPDKEIALTASVNKSVKINDADVTIKIDITYPKAVNWTGSKITRAQIAVLAKDGEIAKVQISGLENAVAGLNKDVDLGKLIKVSYVIGKNKKVGEKGNFYVKLTLNSKICKKAKIKGNDKKALNAFIKDINKDFKEHPYEFDITAVDISDAGTVESVSLKAAFKNGELQLNEDGTIRKLKSLKIKVKVPGLKKAKTYTFSGKKIEKSFTVKLTDAAGKKAEISALEGQNFKGSRSGVDIVK